MGRCIGVTSTIWNHKAAVAIAPWAVGLFFPRVHIPHGLVVAAWIALLFGVVGDNQIINHRVGIAYGAVAAIAMTGLADVALIGGVVLIGVILYTNPLE